MLALLALWGHGDIFGRRSLVATLPVPGHSGDRLRFGLLTPVHRVLQNSGSFIGGLAKHPGPERAACLETHVAEAVAGASLATESEVLHRYRHSILQDCLPRTAVYTEACRLQEGGWDMAWEQAPAEAAGV